jgi:class 3 adenylate cyclase
MTETGQIATVEDGRDAFERHAWRSAFESLREADAGAPLEAADLERLGEAAWWLGRLDDLISAFERAYASYQAQGRRRDAARTALRLSAEVGHKQEHAVAAGWLRRAERLLADEPESVEHASLSRAHFNSALEGNNDFEAALADAERTYAIAERVGSPDLLALALHDKGRALVAMGKVDEGMALVDEATVAAVGGELGPHATAAVYCNTITACRDLADFGRAGEWTEAAKRWCERQSIAGFPGMCRVRRAEIVRLRGRWPEAENEVRLATAELRPFYLDYAAEGFYQLGEIRLRVGDLAAAEDYFRQAGELDRDPQPGLALLRLAEGKGDTAAAMLRRALESHPAEDRLGRARLLPAHVEVALARGDDEGAQISAEELAAIAEIFGSAALRAGAAWAAGSVAFGRGSFEEASAAARRAIELWKEVDAPYEGARARVLLAESLRRLGDEESAAQELERAISTFERLGAEPDLAAARGAGGAKSMPLTRQPVELTFMFTDVVGSTPLVEAIGDEAWENLLRWHDQTLRRIVTAHDGEVVQHTGDGLLAVFKSPDRGVMAARAIQRALADHRRDHGFAPQVRIGVHAASGVPHGSGYSGAGVHAAARIAALADEGQILVSVDTLSAAGEAADPTSSREVRLKGLSQPMAISSVAWR